MLKFEDNFTKRLLPLIASHFFPELFKNVFHCFRDKNISLSLPDQF